MSYRGRIAPSPTGYLHIGHARTFWIARQRAIAANGTLILRNEDLDRARCKPEFVSAMFEDLKWFGFQWAEGPDRGGTFAPYSQSERIPHYRAAFEKLKATRSIYPCTCSRQDVLRALAAPPAGDDDPLYPGTCRPGRSSTIHYQPSTSSNWRFQVPDGAVISFVDGHYGRLEFVAGKDFGDFVVWRHD